MPSESPLLTTDSQVMHYVNDGRHLCNSLVDEDAHIPSIKVSEAMNGKKPGGTYKALVDIRILMSTVVLSMMVPALIHCVSSLEHSSAVAPFSVIFQVP
jgi:hypothetical protein